jgi:hypothetical protein
MTFLPIASVSWSTFLVHLSALLDTELSNYVSEILLSSAGVPYSSRPSSESTFHFSVSKEPIKQQK